MASVLWSAWVQSIWLLADLQGRYFELVSVPLVDVGSVTEVAAVRQGRWSGLASAFLDGVGSATVVCPPTLSLHVFEIISMY